jgi:8-oxo-dGTP pyrophosphatase MutT (NUDIX family)
MTERSASRLLVLDPQDRLLLFQSCERDGYWFTVGGGVDPGEDFEAAALRELFEETGVVLADPGPQVAQRRVTFPLVDGTVVTADERYFIVRAPDDSLDQARWSETERQHTRGHKWWTATELRETTEQIWPEDIADMLANTGVWPTR